MRWNVVGFPFRFAFPFFMLKVNFTQQKSFGFDCYCSIGGRSNHMFIFRVVENRIIFCRNNKNKNRTTDHQARHGTATAQKRCDLFLWLYHSRKKQTDLFLAVNISRLLYVSICRVYIFNKPLLPLENCAFPFFPFSFSRVFTLVSIEMSISIHSCVFVYIYMYLCGGASTCRK